MPFLWDDCHSRSDEGVRVFAVGAAEDWDSDVSGMVAGLVPCFGMVESVGTERSWAGSDVSRNADQVGFRDTVAVVTTNNFCQPSNGPSAYISGSRVFLFVNVLFVNRRRTQM